MDTTLITILAGVLDIIEYQGDKNVCMQNLLMQILQRSQQYLQSTLSQEQIRDLTEKLTGMQSVAQIRQQIAAFIPEEEYDKAVQEFTKDIFSDFFTTLLPMAEDKKAALDAYLNKMSLAIDLSNLPTARRNNYI